MKSKSLMLMGLSIGFGLIAAIGITQVMGRSNGNSQPVTQMGPVLVAADHLDMYAKLTEENVKIENWPVNIIPEDAVTSIDQITDNIVLARISKGMPLVSSTIVNEKKHKRVEIPEGFKVVAIKVSGDDTISGLLNPGDKVDIMGFFKKRGKNGQTQTTSRTFLKALRVFSINNSMRAGGDREEESIGSGSAIVGVLVNEKQAEDIYFAQQTGEIKLVMRGETAPGDDEVDDLSSLMEEWDEGPEDSGSNFAPIEPAFTPPPKKQSMIIWEAGSPRKVEFVHNDMPIQVGANDRPQRPEDRDLDEDMLMEEDSGDFNGSADIDRRPEED